MNSAPVFKSGRVNVQPNNYWSGTEYAPNTSNAWNFNFNMGRNRRGAAFGFPCTRTDEFLRRLRDRQRPVMLIGETPVDYARIRVRSPVARYAWSGSSAG